MLASWLIGEAGVGVGNDEETPTAGIALLLFAASTAPRRAAPSSAPARVAYLSIISPTCTRIPRHLARCTLLFNLLVGEAFCKHSSSYTLPSLSFALLERTYSVLGKPENSRSPLRFEISTSKGAPKATR